MNGRTFSQNPYKRWKRHHHKCTLMQEYLVDENIETLPPPAYFPDFAPCDFFLFPVLKQNVLLDEDSTHDHPPSDEPFFTVFFTCVYTQDRIQTGISVFRLSPDVILCGWLGLKHQLTN